MTWKAPTSEEAWQECLSAYLDGEIPDEDRRALEEHLEHDDARTGQLEEMRRLSNLLQEWQVEAPEPQPAFVRAMRDVLETKAASGVRAWFAGLFAPGPRPRWRAAMFLAGVFAGVFSTLFIQERIRRPESTLFTEPPRQPVTQVIIRPDVVQLTISPNQADDLLREVAAANLRARILEQIDKKDMAGALAAYQTISERYSDTIVFQELEQNNQLRRLAALLTSGRI